MSKAPEVKQLPVTFWIAERLIEIGRSSGPPRSDHVSAVPSLAKSAPRTNGRGAGLRPISRVDGHRIDIIVGEIGQIALVETDRAHATSLRRQRWRECAPRSADPGREDSSYFIKEWMRSSERLKSAKQGIPCRDRSEITNDGGSIHPWRSSPQASAIQGRTARPWPWRRGTVSR